MLQLVCTACYSVLLYKKELVSARNEMLSVLEFEFREGFQFLSHDAVDCLRVWKERFKLLINNINNCIRVSITQLFRN